MRAAFAAVATLALVVLFTPSQLAAGPSGPGSAPLPVVIGSDGWGHPSPVAAAPQTAAPPVPSAPTRPSPEQPTCVASWFGEELRGAVQASGIPFDPDELVAAMWDVPFGTEVLVDAPATGRSVVVAITDRGPAHRLGRCIDLSAAAFAALTDLDVGLVDVVLHTPTDDEEHHHGHPRSHR